MMHDALTPMMHELMHLIVQIFFSFFFFFYNFEKLAIKLKFYEQFLIFDEQKPQFFNNTQIDKLIITTSVKQAINNQSINNNDQFLSIIPN